MLERRGIISGYEGSKPRQVLVAEAELPRMLDRLSGGDPAPADDPAETGNAPAAELEAVSARVEQGA
jgi:hypothetical protein